MRVFYSCAFYLLLSIQTSENNIGMHLNVIFIIGQRTKEYYKEKEIVLDPLLYIQPPKE